MDKAKSESGRERGWSVDGLVMGAMRNGFAGMCNQR
jgi:hypothetical protein